MDYPGKVITKTQVTPTQTSASGNWTLDDQAAAIKNNNWPVALVPNPISKSLRFNSADTAYLNRTPSVAGNRKTWTWSGWVKRAVATTNDGLIDVYISSTSFTTLYFQNNHTITFQFRDASNNLGWSTAAVFRDPSAWYHVVAVIDTTQASSANTVKIYVNGVQQTVSFTAFSGSYTQNADYLVNSTNSHTIGTYFGGYSNQYQTEVNFIDGQALTPSSFGMTNPQTGQWIPLKYSGTYGTNGFYLNFKDATSTTTLGYDYSGNANNWTTNNFSVTAGAGNDSLTDVPTPWFAYNTTGDVGGVVRGNYCTLNPLDNAQGATFSNGNLQAANASATDKFYRGTFGMSSGKWYWEIQLTTVGNRNRLGITDTGLIYNSTTLAGNYALVSVGNQSSNTTGTLSGTVPTFADGDYITFALDEDTGILYFEKNAAPNTSTSPKFTGLSTTTTYFVTNQEVGGTPGVNIFNFGQRPFAYTPPTGFRSLCTTNLPATAIGFGPTNQGNNYFNATTYTGTGSDLAIVNSGGMAPDFVWVKVRNQAFSHNLNDIIRGTNNRLQSDTTAAAGTTGIVAFNSNGFTTSGSAGELGTNGNTYVAWQWKGGGTGVSNTAGTITSTVSANTTAGFSVVTYTGNGTNGATVGHGLGVAPNMMIFKRRNTGGTDWIIYHSTLGATQNLAFDTAAAITSSTRFNNTAPTSTVFTLGTTVAVNGSADTYVAYCFAAVPGYSAFGSYTGNGSADGPFVYVGFRPRYVMVKASSTGGAGYDWFIHDTARDTYNVCTLDLEANLALSENQYGAEQDILSNGFKLRNTGGGTNGSGVTYIYMAFAEFPFQFANAR